MADREPMSGAGRPTGDMQPVRPPLATPHSTHDLVLLAAAVDRDADASLRTAAADQVAACGECASIAADLRSLAAAIGDLPVAQPAPRDFRLSPGQAARLRRGSLWVRLLRPFGSEGLAALRPLAAALTTLGVAGLLLTAIPLGFPSGAALPNTIGSPVGGSSAPYPALAPAASAAGFDEGSRLGASFSPAPPAASAPGGAVFGDRAGGASGPSGTPKSVGGQGQGPQVPPLAWISLACLAAGLGLVGLRLVARRVT